MNVFAVKHKDEDVIANSRSGGIFTALSDMFINSGAIYGCVLDDTFKAIHVRTDKKEDRDRMRGSKYLQSNLKSCYKEVLCDLQEGKNVLFSGTSCQIDGLKCFLGKDYGNLLCVDIVCHGVNSPKVWKSYLDYCGEVKSVDFRNKKDYGWRNHVETIITAERTINSKVWTNLFYSGNILRPSCYECPYKSIHHPGDITIADYWGIEKAAPEFDDNKGVSLVLVNTDKGAEWFERCKSSIKWKQTRIEDSMQRAFERPEIRPEGRDRFWNDYSKKDFSKIVKQYSGQVSLMRTIARKVKRIIKK